MLKQRIYDCCSQTNAFTDQTVTAVGCSSIRKWLANWGAATTGSQRWSSWWLWGWPEGVKTNFCWTKCIWQGYFAKKMDQIAHFCPEWWFKHFTPAYRGSPPPAVFQNKYQKRNMKEIQQGNLLMMMMMVMMTVHDDDDESWWWWWWHSRKKAGSQDPGSFDFFGQNSEK